MYRTRSLLLVTVTAAAAAIAVVIIPRYQTAQAQPGAREVHEEEAEELRELTRHAQRMGMTLEELLAAQHEQERAIQLERAKVQPQMLVHEGALFVLADREWLYLFDAQTLELKNMQNLELLRHEFREELEEQELDERGQEREER